MSRICGWVGFEAPEESRRALLEAMIGARSGEPPRGGAFWHTSSCALAAVPGPGGVSVHRGDSTWVVVDGPVRFDDRALSSLARERGAAAALAEGYERLGRRVLDSLRDGFAFAIVTPQTAEVLLAIDRIGGRHPLAYQISGATLLFGTDSGMLRAHPQGVSAIDPQGLFNYLYFHVVPAPGTIRKDVRRLMPGELLRFESGAGRIERYWRIEYLEHERVAVPRLAAELHQVLRDSVGRDASGPVGAFLSGGTDSSTVVGVLGEVTGSPARAFSIGFEAQGYDEMEYARTAARHFGAQLHEYYVRPDDVVDAIPRLAAAHAEPFGNASAVPAYYCARMAHEDGVRHLLAGDGGDELFAGNERYATQRILGLYDRLPVAFRRRLLEPTIFGFPAGDKLLPVRKARSYIRQASVPMPKRMQAYAHLERVQPAQILDADFLAAVDTGQPMALLDETYHGAAAESMLTRMLAVDLRFTLADNDLPKVSRSCALAGVEVTYPLLADDLVDFARRIPPGLNLRWGRLRWFWKHALRDYLPRKILKKSKHGFGLPFGTWMRDHARLGEMARDSVEALKRRAIVRPEYVDELLRRHETEHAAYYGAMIWLLVMLEHWFRAHVDGPHPLPALSHP